MNNLTKSRTNNATQVINQDEYTKSEEYDEKSFIFTKEIVGTGYFCLIVCILVSGEDEERQSYGN